MNLLDILLVKNFVKVEHSIDYVILESYPNRFPLFCEANDKMEGTDKCYIIWDSKGIECILIRNGKFHLT